MDDNNKLEPESDYEIVFKQNIIQREILDKNYDRDSFYDYCINTKSNGNDLANWTLKELTDVINGFIDIQEKNTKTQEEKDKFYRNVEAQFEELQKSVEQVKEKMFISSNIVPPEFYKKQCKKIDKSALNDINSSVIIENPKIIVTNLLSSNYVNYDVKTLPLDWLVKRRFSDFEWLRSILVRLFPKYGIPPLPNKKLGSRRFEPEFVEKRMKFMQFFIDHLMSIELLKASEVLITFLSQNDRMTFETQMKEYASIIPSPYVEDARTLTGFLWTSHDDENYFSNITKYFNLEELLFERLNYNFKHFNLSMSAVCKNLEEIHKDFETLRILNEGVSMKEKIIESYKELGSFFENWRRIMMNQNSIVKADLKDFFKYTRMECSVFKELIQNRNEMKQKYIQENTRLNNKKEKLWTSNDMTQWDLNEREEPIDYSKIRIDKQYAFNKMCAKETSTLASLYNQSGFVNQNTKDELRRIVDRHCVLYTETIKMFGNHLSPTINDELEIWTQLMDDNEQEVI